MNDFEERIRTDPAPAVVRETTHELIETIRQMVDTTLQPNRESLVPTLHEQIDKILVAVTNNDWSPAKASSNSKNLVKQIDLCIDLLICCSDLDARYQAAVRLLRKVFVLISSVTDLADTYKASPAFFLLSDVIENHENHGLYLPSATTSKV
jgi:hypothetical protein